MSQALTKEDLQAGLKTLGDSVHAEIGGVRAEVSGLDAKIDGLHAEMNGLARHFTTSLGKLEERMEARFSSIDSQFVEVNTKLDAIMSGEILVTRKQLERLLTALEAQGIKLNVSEILAA